MKLNAPPTEYPDVLSLSTNTPFKYALMLLRHWHLYTKICHMQLVLLTPLAFADKP